MILSMICSITPVLIQPLLLQHINLSLDRQSETPLSVLDFLINVVFSLFPLAAMIGIAVMPFDCVEPAVSMRIFWGSLPDRVRVLLGAGQNFD